MSIYKCAIHCSFCLLINTDIHKGKFRCDLEPGLKSMSGRWRVYRSCVSCYSLAPGCCFGPGGCRAICLRQESWRHRWVCHMKSHVKSRLLTSWPVGHPGLTSLAKDCRRDRMVAVIPGQFDDVDTLDKHLKPVKAWK